MKNEKQFKRRLDSMHLYNRTTSEKYRTVLQIPIMTLALILMLSSITVAQTTRIVYPEPHGKALNKMVAFRPIEVKKKLLDANASLDFEAAISGDYIVFTTSRNGSYDLYYVNQLGIVDPLVWGPLKQHSADIDGTRVVYTDDSYGNDNVYSIDVTTFQKTPIAMNAHRDFMPAISGSNIVFVTERNGGRDIYYYDLNTGLEDPLVYGPEIQDLPAIDGTLVTWRRIDGVDEQIYATEIGGTPFAVTTGPGYIICRPDISGDHIAYIKDYDIKAFKVSTGQTKQITSNSTSIIEISVHISGNNIVYSDNRNGNYDIFLYDLSTECEYQLTTDSHDEYVTDVDGNTAVFEDNSYGNSNVWRIEWEVKLQELKP